MGCDCGRVWAREDTPSPATRCLFWAGSPILSVEIDADIFTPVGDESAETAFELVAYTPFGGVDTCPLWGTYSQTKFRLVHVLHGLRPLHYMTLSKFQRNKVH